MASQRSKPATRRPPPPPEPGTSQPAQDVLATLWKFRREHNWAPGLEWDPCAGAYVHPDDQTYHPSP